MIGIIFTLTFVMKVSEGNTVAPCYGNWLSWQPARHVSKGRLTNLFCNQKRPVDIWGEEGVLSSMFFLSQINIDF